MIQTIPWSDRLPEFLHISMALVDNGYETVKRDFHRVADYVNAKQDLRPHFHFNLSHALKLIQEDPSILSEVLKTVFKEPFEQLIQVYTGLFGLRLGYRAEPNLRMVLKGYKQLLNARDDVSILCKYMMCQYDQVCQDDPFDIFAMQNREVILEPDNVSRVMSIFPASIGISENLDLDFCHDIWMHNYYHFPTMIQPNDDKADKAHYDEMDIDGLSKELLSSYQKFQAINLWAIYPTLIAEINMGLVARIVDLTFDAISNVKERKGEIAELIFRTVLENFVVGSWLLKKREIDLHKRFREYSTGRERFFGEKLFEQSSDGSLKKGAQKMIDEAIKDSGQRKVDVAAERGDVFDVSLGQMADEVWGKDNMYYFLYKRTSEVTHGQWRVIARYHLAKSRNPMHNGLYFYNDERNSADLVPAFTCLGIATIFLVTILKDIKPSESGGNSEIKALSERLEKLERKIFDRWMVYFDKYIRYKEDPSSLIVSINKPSEINSQVLQQITELVISGGEVKRSGLKERVAQADWIGFIADAERVLCTATIKNPNAAYRTRTFKAANVPLNRDAKELGYAVTDSEFSGKGLCKRVISSLMEHVTGEYLYATSRKPSMIHILKKFGFAESGEPFNKDLRLLIREPVN